MVIGDYIEGEMVETLGMNLKHSNNFWYDVLGYVGLDERSEMRSLYTCSVEIGEAIERRLRERLADTETP